jgi:hypothetical protein
MKTITLKKIVITLLAIWTILLAYNIYLIS